MTDIKNLLRVLMLLFVVALVSCDDDDDEDTGGETGNEVVAPNTYSFERDGESTVSYSGQTTRLKMAEEIGDAFKDTDKTEAQIDAMFAHEEGAEDFSDAELNSSSKNVRGKLAASTDYFSDNSAGQGAVRADFDGWIKNQVDIVFPAWGDVASEGVAGQIADGSSTRYVDGNGVEFNQVFVKSLIGGLTLDQIINNYISPTRMAAVEDDNNNDVLDGDDNFTEMEHYWDEAFGYLYGLEDDATAPELGKDDFLNKYLARVEADEDFAGIKDEVYNAFIKGRAAIVAKNYDVRDEQADILKEKLSLVIGVRAVYYLEQGKDAYEANLASGDLGGAFHDFSEGLGFIYSLQFTQNPETGAPYFSREESKAFYDKVLEGDNGLWDVTPADLDAISTEIANAFGFTVTEAGS